MTKDFWTKFVNYLQTFRLLQRTSLVKISENVSWLFLDKFIKILIGLIVSTWVTRYLGPSRFGIYSYAVAFVALFTPLSGLGLANIIVRNIVREPEQKYEYLGTAFFLQFLSSVVSYGLSLLIIFLSKPDDLQLKIIIAILSGMLVFRAWGDTLNYWFQSQIQSKFTVWSSILASITIALIRISLILLEAHLVAFAWAMLFEVILVSLFLTIFYNLNNEKIIQWRIRISQAKSLLKDSWPLILSGMAVVFYMKIDQIMLGNMTSDAELGLYSSAVQLSELWYFIPVAIASSFYPAVISSRDNQTKIEYKQRMQLFFDLMAAIAYVIMFITYIFAPWVVSVLYGADYIESGTILRVHIWAFMFVSLGVARSNWLLAENMVKFSMFATLLGAVVNIGLNFWLIPKFAGLGAAWATVISYSISAFFSSMISPKVRHLFTQQSLALFVPFRLRSTWTLIKGQIKG